MYSAHMRAHAHVLTADQTTPRLQVSVQLVAYLALLAIAELAVTFMSPLLVFPLHGGLIALLVAHVAVLERRRPASAESRALEGLLIALVTAPLIRIISLTLPMTAVDVPYRYVLAGVPMLIGGILAARAAGLGPSEIGLAWHRTGVQIAVICASLAIGLLEYAILRPAAAAPMPWVGGGLLPAIAIGVATGFPEEFIFRGVMQGASRKLVGRWNWIYISAVFAVMHIGYESAIDVGFVFAVGLLFGYVTERTRSILGVSVAHGTANVVLLCIAPNLGV
jgi:CAAX protease family protein